MTESDKSDLRDAAEQLESAREQTDDAETAERIDSSADQLRKMIDADRGPDHGRLDRLMHNLRDIESALDGDAAKAVSAARSFVRSYRETVEGV